MKTATHSLDSKFAGLTLLLAPVLLLISTFFWEGKEYGVTGGTILVIALVFWIPALCVLYYLLRDKMPYVSRIGIVVSIYSCVGGINFGFVGVYSSIFSISHQTYLEGFSHYPVASNLLLFWPGPLFVINLFFLAISLIRTRTIPIWTGIVLCVGTLTFPVSRILRIELLAHFSDILMAIPLLYLGWAFSKTSIFNPPKSNLSPSV
ncbi:hypothetical protein QNI19_23180 [Cytophagaceae bacterium DM2B3-1]|uniref:Uncharacterized protein n=1 Tax=Xanthocytophaga flava TaxID=3048013 RepID=A0ABT7CQ36_9BACT|nr:hypothetical protein [Xanthocytophaga flavus]MDJ1495858.1 hypothetical protein [Xanthocytophaga flavus]